MFCNYDSDVLNINLNDFDTNDNTDCNLIRKNTQIIKNEISTQIQQINKNEKNSQIECNESPTRNNTNSFLNEIESWKDLNKIRKRRGKYLSACPDIDILYKTVQN